MQRSTRAPVFINTARVDGNVWKLVFYLFLELVVVIKGTSDFCRNGDREETIRRNWRIDTRVFLESTKEISRRKDSYEEEFGDGEIQGQPPLKIKVIVILCNV